MRPVLLLLAVIMIAAAIIASDHARRTATAIPLAEASLETVLPAGPPAQRDPRLARIAACDHVSMALAEDLGTDWWDMLEQHRTDDGLPDEVLLARAGDGNLHAMVLTGIAFILWADDDGNHAREAEGMAWIQRAAEAGEPTAQNELGYALAGGHHGLARDPERARIWLEKAIRGGDALAGYTLASLQMEGLLAARPGETASAAELALAADLIAAQRCYVDSIDRIAGRLTRGRLLPRDLVTAGYLRRRTHEYRQNR